MAERKLYSVRTIAQLLQLTDRRVRQLADEGVIPRESRGKYDLVGSVRGYINYLREQLAAKELGRPADDPRAALIQARADAARIEADLAMRSVYRRDEADRVIAAIMETIASRLEALGVRVSGHLAALSDPAAICDYIDRETRKIREDAARELLRLGAGDDRGASAPAAADANGGPLGGREARAPAGLG